MSHLRHHDAGACTELVSLKRVGSEHTAYPLHPTPKIEREMTLSCLKTGLQIVIETAVAPLEALCLVNSP